MDDTDTSRQGTQRKLSLSSALSLLQNKSNSCTQVGQNVAKLAFNDADTEWSLIGAGELANVAENSRTSSVASSCSDSPPPVSTDMSRSAQNRRTGLWVERLRLREQRELTNSRIRRRYALRQSMQAVDRWADSDNWAQEFEDLCICEQNRMHARKQHHKVQFADKWSDANKWAREFEALCPC
eukprot:230439-Rhodomonas_salina.2